jgi:RHS repeat-associated protein
MRERIAPLVAVVLTLSLLQMTPGEAAQSKISAPAVQKTKPVAVHRMGIKHAKTPAPAETTRLRTPKWPRKKTGIVASPGNEWTAPVEGVSVRTKTGNDNGRGYEIFSLGSTGGGDDIREGVQFTIRPTADPVSDAPREVEPSGATPTPSLTESPVPTEPEPSALTETPTDETKASDATVGKQTEPVEVRLDYSEFADAYGGDWSSRLQLSLVRDCKTLKVKKCEPTSVLPTDNNARDKTVTAKVPADAFAASGVTTLAATAAASSEAGDFSATPLTSSSSWSGGGQSGDFNWSYPLDVPPGVNGPTPKLSINYSSGSVDGKMASTNNQTSWIGEGFSLDLGYVERSYIPCRDVDTDKDESDETDDLCWRNDNLTMSFGSHSGKLIRDGSSSQWRFKDDDGTRIQLKTDADNPTNRDNNGEYWVATTTDGTQYYFGRNKRIDPDATAADSVSTVPVYGSRSGEPCHDSTFATSDCRQAWRWSVDYVVDPHGNSMSFLYDQETNTYGTNDGASDADYDRAAILKRIDYGTRSGQEGGNAPVRVVFGTDERCVGDSDYCSDIKDNASHWPDVPVDQICSSSCDDNKAPTFFSRKRLTSVTTQTLDPSAGTYSSVNEWELKQSFPASGDGTDPALWLGSIQQTGKVGTDVTLPATTFFGTQMDNRVDAVGDSADPFIKRRVTAIKNGTGGTTSVLYSEPDCTSSDKPSGSDESLATNNRRCFPGWYQPPGFSEPRLEFFHKYRVETVTDADETGGAPAVYTNYTYKGGDGWHYTDDDIQRAKYRTWNEWRGYEEVATVVGNGTTKSYTSTLYMRGMDGDKAATGSKDVWITDTVGPSDKIEDKGQYQGFTRRTITKLGAGGATVDVAVNSPTSSGVTAENSEGEKAYIVNTGVAETSTPLSSGGNRLTKTTTTYDGDGMAIAVDDAGDLSTTTDDRCTVTDYTQNRNEWMLNYPKTVTTTGAKCGTAPSSGADVISANRTYYDAGTLTKGDATKVESASGWDNGITYQTDATTTYDAYGRATSVTNAKEETTATAYSPSSGVPTALTTTSPLGQTSSSTINRAWGSSVHEVDISGGQTDFEYDALGRVTKTWIPGRQKDSGLTPTYTYAYVLRSSGANTVTSNKLNAAENYVSTVQLYDGLMRERSTQAPAAGDNGGWLISEKIYDSRGLVVSDRGPFWTTTDPGGNLVVGQESDYPTYTNYTYDGASRVTKADFASRGAIKWSTTTAYGGDRVSTTPPAGGTPTTTVTDARGQTTSVMQYTGTAPSGTADSTTYTYTPAGRLSTITNAAGNVWKREYDIRGRLITDKDPDKGLTSYTYDSLDRELTSTDARGYTLWNGYDKLGRKTALRDDSADGTLRASWRYDTVMPGLLASSTRYVGSDEYTTSVTSYDAAGRVTEAKLMLPTSEGLLYKQGGYVTKNTYNVDGSIKTQIGPSVGGLQNEQLAWSYDKLGNVNTFGGVGSFINDTVYSPYGQVIRRDLGPTVGKSVYDVRDYDEPTGRLTRHVVSTQLTSAPALDLRYTYDPSGNVKKLNDVAPGDTAQTSTSTMRQCFEYDYLRRMTKAFTSSGNTCAAPTTTNLGTQNPYWDTYTYDKSGNRTKRVNTTTSGTTVKTVTSTSTYPAAASPRPHAVSSVVKTGSATGTESFSYDDNGNTASRSTSATAGQTIEWDREGHQKSVTDKVTGKKTEYVYDADGARLIKRDGVAGATTLYVGTAEVTLKGTTFTTFRSYSVGDEPVVVRDSSGLKLMIADHHNTPVLTFDGSSLAATKRRQDPFGQPLAAVTWPTSRGFLNKSLDSSTGTTNVGAREYDPTLGRFMSADAIMDPNDPQQLNGYAYANNSPVTMSDPTGLRAWGGDGASYRGVGADGRTCGDCQWLSQQYLSYGNKPPHFWRNVAGGAIHRVGQLGDTSLLLNPVTAPAYLLGARPGGYVSNKFDEATGATEDNGAYGVGETIIDLLPIGGGGGVAARTGATTFEKVMAGFAEKESTEAITKRLQKHVDKAVRKYDVEKTIGMTKAQARAAEKDRSLEPLFRGQVIDKYVKNAVKQDKKLNKVLWVSRSGEYGPDFHNIMTDRWWDITTPGAWSRHNKYTRDGFGTGSSLFTK